MGLRPGASIEARGSYLILKLASLASYGSAGLVYPGMILGKLENFPGTPEKSIFFIFFSPEGDFALIPALTVSYALYRPAGPLVTPWLSPYTA